MINYLGGSIKMRKVLIYSFLLLSLHCFSNQNSAYKMNYKENWGYGCGGHCSYQFKSKSEVSIKFIDKKIIVVKDKGIRLRKENYPNARKSFDNYLNWDILFKGTYKKDRNKIIINLQLEKIYCSESKNNKKVNQLCNKKKRVKKIKLVCENKDLQIYESDLVIHKKKTFNKNLLVCKVMGTHNYFYGKEFPWTLAKNSVVNTLKTGAGFPQKYIVQIINSFDLDLDFFNPKDLKPGKTEFKKLKK